MFYLLTVLILIASIALVLLVIVQKSKGGGLASPFASTNNIMGVRKTTDVLEKATWWLFGIVAVLCIASSHFLGTGTDADSKTQQVLEQNAAKDAAPTALPALGGGAAPQQGAPAAAPAPATEAPAPAAAPANQGPVHLYNRHAPHLPRGVPISLLERKIGGMVLFRIFAPDLMQRSRRF